MFDIFCVPDLIDEKLGNSVSDFNVTSPALNILPVTHLSFCLQGY